MYKMHFDDWLISGSSQNSSFYDTYTTGSIVYYKNSEGKSPSRHKQRFFAFIDSLIEHLQFLQENVPLRCLLNGTEETHFMSWFEDLTPKVKSSKWLGLKMLMLGCEEF